MPGLKAVLPLLFVLVFLSACERGERGVEGTRPPAVNDTAGVAERLDALTERPDAVVDTIPADRTDLDVARRIYERAPGDPEAAIVHPDGAATPGPDWPSLLGRTPQEVRAVHGEPRLKIEMAAEARLAWAYLPYENDDAAYYILFRDGRVRETSVEPFEGLRSDAFQRWFE